jgi:hypothetical protein
MFLKLEEALRGHLVRVETRELPTLEAAVVVAEPTTEQTELMALHPHIVVVRVMVEQVEILE